MRTLDDRYHNDANFARLVETIEALIRHGEFTPSEIREAALLAQLRQEMHNPRTTFLSRELQNEIAFRCQNPGEIIAGFERPPTNPAEKKGE